MFRMLMLSTFFLVSVTAFSQTSNLKELARLKYSDPSAQGMVKIELLEGSLIIEGHDSEEIVVYGDQPIQNSDAASQNHQGLRMVKARSSGLEIKEANNQLRINASHWSEEVNLHLKVPRKSSLNLDLVNGGSIKVVGVQGEFDIEVINGYLEMDKIRGSVLAHVLNDNLKINFEEVTPGKPMSFSSLNGTIDVTLPADIKATFHCDTKNGHIFTGFDSEFKTRSSRKEHDRTSGSHIVIKEEVVADVNGGSKDPYTFKTMNGDILIRKGQ